MRCQLCQKNRAEIHQLEKIDGEWVQQSICEQCAAGQQSAHGMPGQMPPGASKIFQFFGSLLSASEQSKVPETVGELLDNWEPDAESETERSCPGCGMSFEQFQELRRLGCSRCYETWAAELEQLFHTVHDAQQHVGKVPGRPSKAMASPLEVKQLKEKLEAAISEERFEEAALYRDKLRELLEGSGDAP